MENKELDNRFFLLLHNLLEEHIESKAMVQEIDDIVKNICRLNGYSWNANFEWKLDNENDKDDFVNLKKQLEYYKSLSEL